MCLPRLPTLVTNTRSQVSASLSTKTNSFPCKSFLALILSAKFLVKKSGFPKQFWIALEHWQKRTVYIRFWGRFRWYHFPISLQMKIFFPMTQSKERKSSIEGSVHLNNWNGFLWAVLFTFGVNMFIIQAVYFHALHIYITF